MIGNFQLKKFLKKKKSGTKQGKKEVIHKCPGRNSQKVTPAVMAEAL